MSYRCLKIFRRKQFFFIIIFVGFLFLVYQIFSVNQLGDELARRNNGFRTNYRQYEKADDIINIRDAVMPHMPERKAIAQEPDYMERRDFEGHNELNGVKKEPSILGIVPQDEKLYMPSASRTFHCISGRGEIPYDQLNDDFCDCEDGSDEPSTNACPNGRFYCTFQTGGDPVFIVSSRVNDGICDCCDGSDEWKKQALPSHLKLPEQIQMQLKISQVPCRNRCRH